MAIVVRRAWLVSLDPLEVRWGELRIEGEMIVAVGDTVPCSPGDQEIDAGEAVVLPGLVNGHAHLYSTLAVGMPPPQGAPAGFHEILRYIWWRLDRALDQPSCETSALVGGIEALRCGTTTLVDHHASPSAIDGSLDAIEAGLNRAGLRGILCYETTDRNGAAGGRAGLAENERYLKRCQTRRTGRFAAMVGGHAAFTMSDDTLAATSDLARRYETGVHLHVAEDPCDDAICIKEYGGRLVDRLAKAGVFHRPSLLAHCTNLSDVDFARLNRGTASIAHNPRSNMNNAVGYARLVQLERPVVLGTDGIGSDMFAELAFAWFKSRDGRAGLSTAACLDFLVNGSRLAGRFLGVKLGALAPGYAADVVITDYRPATPLNVENCPGHLIFGMSSRHVRDVIVAGEWRLRDRQLVGLDETDVRRRANEEARRLWDRMSSG